MSLHRTYSVFNRIPQLLCSLLVMVLAVAPIGCDEGPDSETAIQKSLDTLLHDLQVATSGNKIENLEAVIASANRVRPSSQSQKQTKKLLLSTAKEKLAQLKFQTLCAKTNSVSSILKLAETQSLQVALLRDTADSLLDTSKSTGTSKSSEITSAQNSIRNHFKSQRIEANSELADLESQSQAAREDAEALRQQASQLLIDAEEEGVIEGFETYKAGAQALRQSQLIALSAAEIELQSSMHAMPMLEEAEAELEAISLILGGMEDTQDMLQVLLDTSVKNAADYNSLADEIDAEAAETLSEAIELGNTLIQEWQNLSDLTREAMQGAGRSRGASREAQKTSGIWKLDLEWTLGQIEEAKHIFLLEELRALDSFIERGIVTSSSKWRNLTSSLSTEIEQAKQNALAAYENAIQLTSSVGDQSASYVNQLNTRIAILNGENVPTPSTREVENRQPTSTTTTPSTSSVGNLETPQELAESFNDGVSVNVDGKTSQSDIRHLFIAEDPEAKSFVDFMSNIIGATTNILIAVRDNMGEEAMQEFLAKNPIRTTDLMPPINVSSISMQSEDIASAKNTKGEPLMMHKTPDGWKIYLSSSSEQNAELFAMAEQVSTMMSPLMDMMNSLAEQIRNGEITTIDELDAAGEEFMADFNPF